MDVPIDLALQLPDDAAERRRLQNRLAQRKFRRKHALQSPPWESDTVFAHLYTEKREKRQQEMINRDENASTTAFGSSSVSSPAQVRASVLTQSISPPTAANVGSFSSDLIPGAEDLHLWNVQFESLDGNLLGIGTPVSTGPSNLVTDTVPTAPSRDSAHFSSASLKMPPHDTGSNHAGSADRSPWLDDQLRMVPTSPAPDSGWLSALHIAAQRGHEGILRSLMLRGNLDYNGQDSDGRTPLMLAVIGNHEKAVELLLAHGAKLDVTDQEKRSALHWAVLYQHERVLRLILEGLSIGGQLDACINSYDASGWTPLHMAAHHGFDSGVSLLLEFGADLDLMARKCPYAGKH